MKLMLQTSANTKNLTNLQKAILSTLSFFDIYKLPLSAQRIWELLYRFKASIKEVEGELHQLEHMYKLVRKDNLYALSDWDHEVYEYNQLEIKRRWDKIKKYYWLLSAIPFVESLAVINSVAMGNADHESDIDFFVITRLNRLYFVRTVIIVLFKLLGVYKTRDKINEQFCFGFYVTPKSLALKPLLLEGDDPYMTFWLGTLIPIVGRNRYEQFINQNRWLHAQLPNFSPALRIKNENHLKPNRLLKAVLSVLLSIPAVILEPLLRWYHIRHTFKLPENHWKTSSTIANANMLKLHALDPRKDLRTQWEDTLKAIG